MDVYQQITDKYFDELNTEIRRGKYPATKLIGFGTIDQSNELALSTGGNIKKANSDYYEERTWKAINDIP